MTLKGISDLDKDLALMAMYGGQTFMLALFHGDDEIEDANYQRMPVTFGTPQGDDVRYVVSLDEVRFPALADEHEMDHWAIFDAAGNMRARMRLRTPRVIPANDRTFFDPETLRIGMP